LVECSSSHGTAVTLDGSLSHDREGDPITYSWTGPFPEGGGTVSGVQPTVTLSGGDSVISLVAADPYDVSDPVTVVIRVVDTTAPSIGASVAPVNLWPPDHKMKEVSVNVSAADVCSVAHVSLVGIDIIDSGSSRSVSHFDPDVAGADIGASDYSFELRSERTGNGSDRTYRITYRATDDAGNGANASVTVVVPHDRGKQ
jgi:hypothetical protein